MRLKNPKAKGTRLEHSVRNLKLSQGYTVIRAAGSLGPVDLVCLHPLLGVEAIQVKCSIWPSGAEMRELRRLAWSWIPAGGRWTVWAYRRKNYARAFEMRRILPMQPVEAA